MVDQTPVTRKDFELRKSFFSTEPGLTPFEGDERAFLQIVVDERLLDLEAVKQNIPSEEVRKREAIECLFYVMENILPKIWSAEPQPPSPFNRASVTKILGGIPIHTDQALLQRITAAASKPLTNEESKLSIGTCNGEVILAGELFLNLSELGIPPIQALDSFLGNRASGETEKCLYRFISLKILFKEFEKSKPDIINELKEIWTVTHARPRARTELLRTLKDEHLNDEELKKYLENAKNDNGNFEYVFEAFSFTKKELLNEIEDYVSSGKDAAFLTTRYPCPKPESIQPNQKVDFMFYPEIRVIGKNFSPGNRKNFIDLQEGESTGPAPGDGIFFVYTLKKKIFSNEAYSQKFKETLRIRAIAKLMERLNREHKIVINFDALKTSN